MTKKHTHDLEPEYHELEHLSFISLVEYKGEEYLCIVDNVWKDSIGVYILDEIERYGINKNDLFLIIKTWFDNESNKIPLSVFLNRLNLAEKMHPIYRILGKTYISRIAGRTFSYGDDDDLKVKRRKVIFPEDLPEIKL